MMTPAVTRLAAAMVALLAAAGLALEYQTYVAGYTGSRLFWRTLDYFSFFTVEANILVMVVASAAVLAGDSRTAARLVRPAVAGAACLYAIVAGATYFFLLRFTHHPVGLALVSDNLLHYIVPPAFLALWLGGLPKGGLGVRTVGRWMIFPAIYIAYALFRGPRTGFSPYPFIDLDKLGYGGVAINVAALVAAFVGVGAALTVLDRALAPRQRRVAAG
jgi:hypothetical protein